MQPHDSRMVSHFIMQALQGKDITVYGDGSQTRSFCSVDDLIEGLFELMQTSDGFTGSVNPSNPQEFSIIELAESILKRSF